MICSCFKKKNTNPVQLAILKMNPLHLHEQRKDLENFGQDLLWLLQLLFSCNTYSVLSLFLMLIVIFVTE